MMATKTNGFRKAVLVGTIVASFGMPLVGSAQEKADERFFGKDTASIECVVQKQVKDKEIAKEKLRAEIVKTAKEIDSLYKRKEELVKLGEKAGYESKEINSVTENEGEIKKMQLDGIVGMFLALGLGYGLACAREKKKKADANG